MRRPRVSINPSQTSLTWCRQSLPSFPSPLEAHGLGAAFDAGPRRLVALGVNPLRPELALFEIAGAARRRDRVHIELPEVGMAHQQSGQIVRQRKPLGAGVRQGFRQCPLDSNRHMEAVLDIMLLPQDVGQGLAVGAERPTDQLRDDGPLGERWRRGTVRPWRVASDDGRDNFVVCNIIELGAWVPHVALGRDVLLRVGVPGESLRGVIEEFEGAPVVVEHQHPIEHLACRVDNADPLGGGLGAADLAVESTFIAAGRVVHQAGFEGYGNELGVDPADNVGLGKDRLTGGAGEYSASGIVDRPVDEDPEQDGLTGGTRLLQPFEQTGLPGDLTPGDADGLQGADLGLQRFRRRRPLCC